VRSERWSAAFPRLRGEADAVGTLGAACCRPTERSPAFIRLQPLLLVLFSGFTASCAISSVVERLLHTQEVAGSNPASRTTRKASGVLHFSLPPRFHLDLVLALRIQDGNVSR
jgi:hypothetical protein